MKRTFNGNSSVSFLEKSYQINLIKFRHNSRQKALRLFFFNSGDMNIDVFDYLVVWYNCYEQLRKQGKNQNQVDYSTTMALSSKNFL